ncbi:MAG: hypothetical protein ACI4NE_03040 [Succinivibrio sp.]
MKLRKNVLLVVMLTSLSTVSFAGESFGFYYNVDNSRGGHQGQQFGMHANVGPAPAPHVAPPPPPPPAPHHGWGPGPRGPKPHHHHHY